MSSSTSRQLQQTQQRTEWHWLRAHSTVGGLQYSTVQHSEVRISCLRLAIRPQAHDDHTTCGTRVRSPCLCSLLPFIVRMGLCRYLVEAPANVCTPRHLAAAAAHIKAISPERFTLKVGCHWVLRPWHVNHATSRPSCNTLIGAGVSGDPHPMWLCCAPPAH
jgi:hypothetical protein